MAPQHSLRAKRLSPVSRQTPLEEWFNTLSHGVGIVLGLIGTVVLVVLASRQELTRMVVGVSVFGGALLLLYGVSTLYHGTWNLRWKRALRVVDHMAIYVLIAGTYTPFALGPLHGPWGWSLLGVIWGMAALGIGFKLCFGARFPWPSTLAYVAMGWLVVIAIVPLARALPGWGLGLLATGGVAYTVGAVFYLLDERVPFFHTVFHVFILIGSASHYWALLDYLRELS